jgi:hypothetical protein
MITKVHNILLPQKETPDPLSVIPKSSLTQALVPKHIYGYAYSGHFIEMQSYDM